MEAGEFWLVLLCGIAVGWLMSVSFRWIGAKVFHGNQQKREGDTLGNKISGGFNRKKPKLEH